MQRKWIVAGAGGALVIGLLVAAGVREQSAAQDKLESARRLARAQGAALTADDFAALLPTPIPDEDAWPKYRQAIALLQPPSEGPRTNRSEEAQSIEDLMVVLRNWRRNAIDPVALTTHQETLARLEPVFRLIEEGAQAKSLQIEKDWSRGLTLPIPEAGDLLRMGRLLILRCVLSAYGGQWESSLADFRRVGHLVRQLAELPMMVFVTMGIALATDVLDVMQLLAVRGILPAALDAKVQTQMDELSKSFALRPSVAAMVYPCLASIKVLSSRESMIAAGIEDRWALRNVPKPQVRVDAEQTVLSGIAAILAKWPKDERDTVAMRAALGKEDLAMDDAMSLLSPMLRRAPAQDADSQLLRQGMFGRFVESAETFHTRFRLLKAMFAARGAQLKNGAYPKSLPLSGIESQDPFDGQPLRYRASPEGILVYSVGANRVDDKGLDTRSERRPADITLRYPGGGSAL